MPGPTPCRRFTRAALLAVLTLLPATAYASSFRGLATFLLAIIYQVVAGLILLPLLIIGVVFRWRARSSPRFGRALQIVSGVALVGYFGSVPWLESNVRWDEGLVAAAVWGVPLVVVSVITLVLGSSLVAHARRSALPAAKPDDS